MNSQNATERQRVGAAEEKKNETKIRYLKFCGVPVCECECVCGTRLPIDLVFLVILLRFPDYLICSCSSLMLIELAGVQHSDEIG